MVEHDDQYNEDIGKAERAAQSLRRGNSLGRVLWGLVEGVATGLGMLDEVLTKVRALHDAPDALCDLGPIEARLDIIDNDSQILSAKLEIIKIQLDEQGAILQKILGFTQIGEPGTAETLNLTLGQSEPNA